MAILILLLWILEFFSFWCSIFFPFVQMVQLVLYLSTFLKCSVPTTVAEWKLDLPNDSWGQNRSPTMMSWACTQKCANLIPAADNSKLISVSKTIIDIESNFCSSFYIHLHKLVDFHKPFSVIRKFTIMKKSIADTNHEFNIISVSQNIHGY